jgi:magnesium chelatase subunit D
MPALNFPFTAVVGQPLFKLALILATINPVIGGVLVSGPRGSAKSTLARSLADVAPFSGDSFPFVTLPLGATEEMLVGTLNLQKVLKEQKVSFQAGLLAKADGGVLYVDEVNLLQDNLVDLLLDVAASGTNVVERDGISHSHQTQFLLMGTMNPDEGELRPQLNDRFGFSVELANEYNIEARVAIVRLREEFDLDPRAFIEKHQTAQATLKAKIILAKNKLAYVSCSDALRIVIAERCQQAKVDGLRADIVWYRAAVAHAAWQAADKSSENIDVTVQDVDAVEELVLAHRRQVPPNNPPQNKASPPQKPFSRPPESYSQVKQEHDSSSNSPETDQQQPTKQGDWGQMQVREQFTSEHKLHLSLETSLRPLTNKTQTSKKPFFLVKSLLNKTYENPLATSVKGRTTSENSRVINWFSSLIANKGQWPLTQLSYSKAKMGQAILHLVLLDTSASTLQNKLLSHAKSAVLSIAEKAYLKREQLTILGFGNQQVHTLLAQKKAPQQLRNLLDKVTAGGGTPLCEVLDHALELQRKHYRQSPESIIRTYLITDGRTTQFFNDKKLLGEVIVIDTEQSSIKRGKGQLIAQTLCADYIPLFA